MDLSALKNLSASEKEQIKTTVKREMAMASLRELLVSVTQKCFERCVSKPSKYLSNSEKDCAQSCMDRYIETWDLTSKTYAQELTDRANGMRS